MPKRPTGIKARIMELVEPLAADIGLDLIDVETPHEGDRTILRLIVDKRGGVPIDLCEALSEAADPVIEREIGFDHYDAFEVSSPGIGRALKTEADRLRHEGEYVKLSLYKGVNGKKRFYGHLVVGDGTAGVEAEGKTLMFPLDDIANIKREIVFD